MPDSSGASIPFEAFFAEWGKGRRFCLLHRPPGAVAGAIVYVPPFAEELNKSRRMAALAARDLARSGWVVLQVDLMGCGDSEGDLSDASWDDWKLDVRCALDWLHRQTGVLPALWGLRAGCLLAVEAARELAYVPELLFWQPVLSGKQHMQQFLRLRVAANMLENGKGAETTESLRERLLAGEEVEVAGYALPPAVFLGFEHAKLDPIPGGGKLAWFELGAAEGDELSPAARSLADGWKRAGWDVAGQRLKGTSFWQTQEIEEAPSLLAATTSSLAGVTRGH